MAGSSALRFSGRASRTSATPSVTSTRTRSSLMARSFAANAPLAASRRTNSALITGRVCDRRDDTEITGTWCTSWCAAPSMTHP